MTAAADSNPPGEYYCATCEKTFVAGDRCPTDGTKLVKLAARIDPFLGRELDGHYTIMEKLGQGGMGAVYRSVQHSVGREVAIKVVSPHLVSDPEVIKRFLREAKLASRLSHPNAVGVLDFGQTDDGVFYLVMELVSGRTLDQVIKSEKVFKPERVVRIGMQVCDALEGAHALQIVHRDLKPANIMLLAVGRDLVKVLDFGLAKSVAPDQASTTMTNAGALLGTPAFMPPELALGQPCDGRADLYSLGVVLYLLASGRLPFVSDSAHELIAMHGTEKAPPLVGVPTPLARVIERMLEKDPARRYQSAAENREALEVALEFRVSSSPSLPAFDTNPSLGPFPADSAMFRQDATPVGAKVRRSATELDRLVNQETMAATGAVHDTAIEQPKRRAWVIPLAAVGALGVGAAVFFAMNKSSASQPPPAKVEPKQVEAPPPPPAPPPEAKPAAEIVVAPPDAGVVVEKAPPEVPKLTKRPKPHPPAVKKKDPPAKPFDETPAPPPPTKPKLPF